MRAYVRQVSLVQNEEHGDGMVSFKWRVYDNYTGHEVLYVDMAYDTRHSTKITKVIQFAPIIGEVSLDFYWKTFQSRSARAVWDYLIKDGWTLYRNDTITA